MRSKILQVGASATLMALALILMWQTPAPSTLAARGNSLLCRLGVDQLTNPVSVYAAYLPSVRAGWYTNFGAAMAPDRPNGIRFAQGVFVKQWKWKDGAYVLYDVDAPYAQPYTYTVSPNLATIQAIATVNPGSLWLVGNEIERRDFPIYDNVTGQIIGVGGQNEILPEVYAWAYHEIYAAIKAGDPTAQVANGSVIVPSPLRLQYLTRVWDEYLSRYGTTMPVDVWRTHVYMAPERLHEWGIDIPAGIDGVTTGLFYYGPNDPRNVTVNKDFTLVPGLIRDLRTWMRDRGQRTKPLIFTEFGVSMPDWVMPGEFTPERIRDEYMIPGLNYMLNQKDSTLGFPADEFRLVQSTWWWSLDYDQGSYDPNTGEFIESFNGYLLYSGLGYPNHSPHAMGFTPLGNHWVNYVSPIPETVNVYPWSVTADPLVYPGDPPPPSVNLHIKISNSGNVSSPQPVNVDVLDGQGNGVGSFTVPILPGCGEQTFERVIPYLSPSNPTIRVRIGTQTWTFWVMGDRAFLPLISR